MHIYKVIFHNNHVISSTEIKSAYFKSVAMEDAHGKRLIKWIIVYADSEQESILAASNVVKKYFTFL